MRIEPAQVEREEESCNLSLEKSESSKKNKRRHKKPMPIVVQQLFETCKEVFSAGGADIVPLPANVDRLQSVLDSMKPEDVGLNPESPYFRKAKNGALPITYLHIYECDKFSIGIFCLPASGVIPLHNHPGMTVFSKLLFGSMHIKSYDWVDIPGSSDKTLKPFHFQPLGVRLSKVKTDAVFTAPCNTSILYPTSGGNMHRFTAVTSCAVLDVLGPPYSDSEGRPCTYYRDFPYASFSVDADLAEGEQHAWLEERGRPNDFVVVGAPYRGPRVAEK